MRRRVLFLVALVALLNVPALAQIGVVLQLTPTANVDAVASRVGGVVLDLDSDTNQVLLSVPAVPSNLLDLDNKTKGLRGLTKPNQSSASYLDESSASYLDESSASYLDESSASYLDQSAASYLDESSASYLDGLNPAYKHGTFNAGIIAAL